PEHLALLDGDGAEAGAAGAAVLAREGRAGQVPEQVQLPGGAAAAGLDRCRSRCGCSVGIVGGGGTAAAAAVPVGAANANSCAAAAPSAAPLGAGAGWPGASQNISGAVWKMLPSAHGTWPLAQVR